MNPDDIESIEIDLLLEAVFHRYGHNFSNYAKASVGRRIRQFLPKAGCQRISQLIPRILHDEDFFAEFLIQFSIPVTEMFRDPPVYRSLKENVAAVLHTYPSVRIWHAGCATGEEAYSLAILLHEEELYDKATIYATDFNDRVLQKAKEGIFDPEQIQNYTRNYQAFGGRRSFSEYYHAGYGAVTLDNALKRHITFANHNLVTDGVFTEAHLILCRNVLIYFNRQLQDRVLTLFRDSLVRGGFLCLGTKETIQFSQVKDDFIAVDEKSKIYKRV